MAVKKPNTFKLLIILMISVTLIVTAITIALLYKESFTQHRAHLLETVQNQARLIETVARLEGSGKTASTTEQLQEATLSHVTETHRQFKGFGETGEFILGTRKNNKIHILHNSRLGNQTSLGPFPFDQPNIEPMRRALSGQFGTFVTDDYRGKKVLTAHEHVKLLNLGLVAKIDIAEISAPFIRTGGIALTAALIIIMIACVMFRKISQPLAQKIEQQAETFRTLVETANEAIFIMDVKGIIQFANPAAETLFGYDSKELPGKSIKQLMPSRSLNVDDDNYITQHLKTGKNTIGNGQQMRGQRKDGSRFPVYLSIGEIKLKNNHLFAGMVMDLSRQVQLQREIIEIPAREQQRIGLELHDGLGQQLTGLSMLAQSMLDKSTLHVHDLASQIADGLTDALSQVRSLSHGLMPLQIDAEGLMLALQDLTEEIEQHSNIPVQLKIDDVVLISDNATAMHLYRITQESLNNAVKHAGASKITVALKTELDHGLLEVEDNGCGIPPENSRSDGRGLHIMKHRCGLFEGEIEVDPSDQGGTRVHCRFPLDPRVKPD